MVKFDTTPINIDMEALKKGIPVDLDYFHVRMTKGTLHIITIKIFEILGDKISVGISSVGFVYAAYKMFSLLIYDGIPLSKEIGAHLGTKFDEYEKEYRIVDKTGNFFRDISVKVPNFFKKSINEVQTMIYKYFEPATLDSYPNKFFPNATYCDDPDGKYLNNYDKRMCISNVPNHNDYVEDNKKNVDPVTLEDNEKNVGSITAEDIMNNADPEDNTSNGATNDKILSILKFIYDFRKFFLIGTIILLVSLFLISKRKEITRKLRLAGKMARKQTIRKVYRGVPYLGEAMFGISFVFSLLCLIIANLCNMFDRKIPSYINRLINIDEFELDDKSEPIYTHSSDYDSNEPIYTHSSDYDSNEPIHTSSYNYRMSDYPVYMKDSVVFDEI